MLHRHFWNKEVILKIGIKQALKNCIRGQSVWGGNRASVKTFLAPQLYSLCPGSPPPGNKDADGSQMGWPRGCSTEGPMTQGVPVDMQGLSHHHGLVWSVRSSSHDTQPKQLHLSHARVRPVLPGISLPMFSTYLGLNYSSRSIIQWPHPSQKEELGKGKETHSLKLKLI